CLYFTYEELKLINNSFSLIVIVIVYTLPMRIVSKKAYLSIYRVCLLINLDKNRGQINGKKGILPL
ncbi:hypothetical protein, partial [Clostridiisalibacter paucivorans]|uniref:hypothetical protein n=1 Tax=Clostridiisalibacter paucivorans TaxID=408753 RepID=UPI00196A54C4